MESDWTVKNDKPHYGLKEHAFVDVNYGFILSITLTPASVNDLNFLPYCTLYGRYTKQPLEKVFVDKGYFGKPNREFLSMNNKVYGIMRKNTTTAKLTSYEKERNKKISKFVILWNNTSDSVICMMGHIELGLLLLLKINLMAGAVRRHLILQEA